MTLMIKILMCGPFIDTGGVAVHTQNVSKYLSDMGNSVIVHNTSTNHKSFVVFENLLKLWQRSFGIVFTSIASRDNYDIIHIQCSGGFFSFVSAISGSFVSKLLKKKLVITFHYRPSKDFISNFYWYIGFVLKKCDAFFVVSEKQKNILKQTFPQYCSKVHVIPNGFNPDKFTILDQTLCRNKLKLPLNAKILLNVGNLVPEKGQKDLIEAMNEIVKQRNDIICVIIGSGSMKNTLEDLILKLQLTKHVILVGKRPHSEIPLWMNACDIFVLPSLIEGNPTVMFECLGCGKPFVGTRVGGVPEVIFSEDYGFLCDPTRPVALADNILLALTKEWDSDKIKEYSKQFTWDIIARKVLDIYSKVGVFNSDIL